MIGVAWKSATLEKEAGFWVRSARGREIQRTPETNFGETRASMPRPFLVLGSLYDERSEQVMREVEIRHFIAVRICEKNLNKSGVETMLLLCSSLAESVR
ncbi:hypothetical protein [Rudaea cellulosilytica]|uniref:hypothetical protein n=1 Tax=Rudaea cellulosilytica TaxID=540746 RepID=UPI0012F92FE0|nr:hypothetical protein [Rudaea cellulosilytica]